MWIFPGTNTCTGNSTVDILAFNNASPFVHDTGSMKDFIEAIQFIAAAAVLFVLVYSLYILVLSMSMAALPAAFVIGVVVVLFTRHNRKSK